jgi:hypothetical protein
MDRPRQTNQPAQRDWGNRFASATGMQGGRRETTGRREEPPYELDTREGEAHARERHTFEGIWKAGKVLTDHPDFVAVFESEEAISAAVRNMPTDPRAWKGRTGRYDAEFDGVHYQGVLLGNTMSLFSCYPVGGLEYPKPWLSKMLRNSRARTSTAFWTQIDELDPLERELGKFARPPQGATESEAGELDGLNRSAGAAIDGLDAITAQELLGKLRLRWNAVKQAAEERAAAVKQKEKERDAEISSTRIALNKAIEVQDKETAQALYLKMKEMGTFISPPAIKGLKLLGINVTD